MKETLHVFIYLFIYLFLTFDKDKLGTIRRYDWKERHKVSEIAKFERDSSSKSRNFTVHRNGCVKVSQLCGAISSLA